MHIHIKKSLLSLAMVFAAALWIAGCEDGPLEDAGEELDRAAEKTGDAVEDAGDKIKDAVDDATD